MGQQKRYVALVEFYIWSNTDEEAINEVNKMCNEQNDKNDDSCELLKLIEQPFGTIDNRIAYVKQ